MRRKEKEVTDRSLIDGIIHQADICHLSCSLEDRPYLVPISFGYDGQAVYIHTAPSGRKTRHLDDVLAELNGFFDAHEAVGTWAGGIHIELTGDDVTECLGGADELVDEDLGLRYETMCDPRLNAAQSLDLAFLVADRLRG